MSDSDDERIAVQRGYVPILADKLQRVNSPTLTKAGSIGLGRGELPQGAMSVYTNNLFRNDGDVLADDDLPPPPTASSLSPRPNTASPRPLPHSQSMAAKRNQRLQQNIYEANPTTGSRPTTASNSHPASPASINQLRSKPSQEASIESPASMTKPADYYDPVEVQQINKNLQVVRPPVPQRLDPSDMRSFLRNPGPKSGPVLCYIVRDRSQKLYPKYNLFLEEGKRFLMAARKRKKLDSSNYVISLDYEDLDRESEKFFGKLRANFVGTEFTIFDSGEKPEKGKKLPADAQTRQELAGVTYSYNVLGTRGPRKMTTAIPAVDGSGRSLYKPTSEEDTIVDRLNKGRGLEELVVMRNKPPRWNEELNAYCLNFNGRVTEASVKNFQLVTDDNHNYVLLQFGKIGNDTFTMDFQWPMSALQAFGICLSSFDNKLACE